MTNYVVIFIVGLIIGIFLMAIIIAANNVQWGCRDGNEDENDLISRKDLIDYLNLDSYDDSDLIKVKYIRAFLNKNIRRNDDG